MEGESPEDRSNAARGHKANLNNPNTSEESKANSQKVLDKMEKDDQEMHYGSKDQNTSKNPNQVAGGLKAAINNPNLSEEGKEKAQEKLDNM